MNCLRSLLRIVIRSVGDFSESLRIRTKERVIHCQTIKVLLGETVILLFVNVLYNFPYFDYKCFNILVLV